MKMHHNVAPEDLRSSVRRTVVVVAVTSAIAFAGGHGLMASTVSPAKMLHDCCVWK